MIPQPKIKNYLLFILLLYTPGSCIGAIVFHGNKGTICKKVVGMLLNPWAHRSLETLVETPRYYLVKLKKSESIHVFDKVSGTQLDDTIEIIDLNNTTIEGPGHPEPTAHIPIYLKKEARLIGGTGTEVKYALLRYSFEQLGFKKVMAYIRPNNTASIRLHEKLGFKILSRTSKEITLELSREDFEAIKSRFQPEETGNFLPQRKPSQPNGQEKPSDEKN